MSRLFLFPVSLGVLLLLAALPASPAQGQTPITVKITGDELNGAYAVSPTCTITIIKETNPAGGQGFSFSSASFPDFSLNDNGSKSFSGLDVCGPPIHNVFETPKPDWTLTNIACAFTSGTGNFNIIGSTDPNATTGFEAGDNEVSFSFSSGPNVQSLECTFTNTKCVDPPAGLAAWWPLDERKGDDTILDIWGGHDGTPQPYKVGLGGPKRSESPQINPPYMVRSSLHFLDGTTFVEVPHHADLEPGSGDFSIDAWVYPVAGADAIQPIAEKWDPDDKGYAFHIQSPGRLTFSYSDGTVAGSPPPVSSIGLALPGNQWSHVAVTFRRVSPAPGAIEVLLYINGQEQGVQVGGSIGAISAPLHQLLIGGTDPFPAGLRQIALDEVEIFKVALSQPDIEAIYNAGSAGKCPPGGGGGGGGVGGTVELLADGADPSALAAGGSGGLAKHYAALAGGLAAAVLALAAGGWYVRRRFRQPRIS